MSADRDEIDPRERLPSQGTVVTGIYPGGDRRAYVVELTDGEVSMGYVWLESPTGAALPWPDKWAYVGDDER